MHIASFVGTFSKGSHGTEPPLRKGSRYTSAGAVGGAGAAASAAAGNHVAVLEATGSIEGALGAGASVDAGTEVAVVEGGDGGGPSLAGSEWAEVGASGKNGASAAAEAGKRHLIYTSSGQCQWVSLCMRRVWVCAWWLLTTVYVCLCAGRGGGAVGCANVPWRYPVSCSPASALCRILCAYVSGYVTHCWFRFGEAVGCTEGL
jgi:hypothetical protein